MQFHKHTFGTITAAVIGIIVALSVSNNWHRSIVGGQVSARTLHEQANLYSIEFEYPVVGERWADTDMGTAVKDMVDSFKKDAKEFESYRTDEAPYEFIGRFDHSRYNEHIVSYLLNAYIYTGGAHGNVVYVSRTYDLENKKILDLSDIFTDVPAALAKIRPVARTQLMSTLRAAGWDSPEPEASGLEAKAENYAIFTLEGYAITFHFPPYQVYAYAAGPQAVSINFADITDLLQPRFRPQ